MDINYKDLILRLDAVYRAVKPYGSGALEYASARVIEKLLTDLLATNNSIGKLQKDIDNLESIIKYGQEKEVRLQAQIDVLIMEKAALQQENAALRLTAKIQ